jgi:hypothetical protein
MQAGLIPAIRSKIAKTIDAGPKKSILGTIYPAIEPGLLSAHALKPLEFLWCASVSEPVQQSAC